MNQVTCPRCGGAVDAGTLKYDEGGDLICPPCHSQASVAATAAVVGAADPSRTGNMWAGAFASVIVGFATLCLVFLGKWFFVASPMAIVAGVTTFRRLRSDPKYRKEMGPGHAFALVLCGTGAVLGSIGTLLGLLLLFIAY